MADIAARWETMTQEWRDGDVENAEERSKMLVASGWVKVGAPYIRPGTFVDLHMQDWKRLRSAKGSA